MASFSGLEVALQEAEASGPGSMHRKAASDDTNKTPTKTRTMSDSTPALSPSPHFKEPYHKIQDDLTLIATPSRTIRHHAFANARSNLSIQMPPRDPGFVLTDAQPKQRQNGNGDTDRDNYGSPSSVLPRHSRGLDFSRACTSLHHSTLAGSSPASSPTIAQKGMMTPRSRRSSTVAMGIDVRSGLGIDRFSNHQEKGSFFPRSFGSATALTSDASSSSSDDDDLMRGTEESEDTMVTTPQIRRNEPGAVTPFATQSRSSFTPRALRGSSPMNFHFNAGRSRASRHLSRHNSISARHHSAIVSGDDATQTNENSSGSHDEEMRSPMSRRGSISFGTNGLHISTGNDSNEGENSSSSSMAAPPTPGVVRRVVTRRSNLLPKTKGFARIRAALQEESAPIDSEAHREAEIVRQVRIKDVGEHNKAGHPPSPALQSSSTPSSEQHDTMSDVDALGIQATDTTAAMEMNQGYDSRRLSTSREFWPHLYNTPGGNNTITPPPPLFHRHRSSSGMSLSEDTEANSPRHGRRRSSRSQSSTSTHLPDAVPGLAALTSEMSEAGADNTASGPSGAPHYIATSREGPGYSLPAGITAAEISRKVSKRRRGDDDFDLSSLKRRAVSPGMASVQSSPVTGQSPVSNTGAWPPQQLPPPLVPPPKVHRESTGGTSTTSDAGTTPNGNASGGVERAHSSTGNASDGASTPQQQQHHHHRGSSTPSLGPKRVGFQGMTDTSDGMMKMSID